MKNNLYWLQLESSIVDLKPCRICQKYSLHYAKETQICCSGEKKKGGGGWNKKHFTFYSGNKAQTYVFVLDY